jgi:chromosome segregation ATPase
MKNYIKVLENSKQRCDFLGTKLETLDDFIIMVNNQLKILQETVENFNKDHTLKCNYVADKDKIFGERELIVKNFKEERNRIDKEIKTTTDYIATIVKKLELLEIEKNRSEKADVDIEKRIKDIENQIESLREHLDNGWSKKIINDILIQNKDLFTELLSSKMQNDNNNFSLQKGSIESKKTITIERIKFFATLIGSGSILWLLIDKLIN